MLKIIRFDLEFRKIMKYELELKGIVKMISIFLTFLELNFNYMF